MQHPENSVMSFLNGRFDSLQFTRSVQFWEKFKDGLKYPAVSSVLMGTGHGKDHVAHSATSVYPPGMQNLCGTNCNCLLSLIKLYEFHHVPHCYIRVNIIRETMVDGLN